MEKIIVSANYMDRESKQRWLLRKEKEQPYQAAPHEAVKAINVIFVPSSHMEQGFGCQMVAACETAQGYSAVSAINKKEFIELEFDKDSFKEQGTDNVVERAEELYLDADGKIFAKLFVVTPVETS